MGNYSKNPEEALQEALKKGYDRVRFQQGKPILDRELNLLGDLLSTQRLAPYIGNGVPTGKGGIRAAAPPDPKVVEFELEPGRCIVNGLELRLDEYVSYQNQPHKENVQKSWPFKVYSKGMQDGPGYVYLRLFLSEVDDTSDTDLQNQADIGFETTLREKVDWELLLSDERLDAPDHFLLAEYYVTGGAAEPWRDRRVIDLTLETLRRDHDELKADYVVKTASLNPSGELAANSVGNINLKDNAVSATKIQELSVTNTKLAPNSVTGPKLADISVGTAKLQDLSVTSGKLQDGSVTNTKLGPGAVDGAKLAANSVDSTKLGANSVVYGKVAPAAITLAQMKTQVIMDTSFNVSASSFIMIVLVSKALVNGDNFLVYTVWGDNDFSWTESYIGGSRILRVQNNTAQAIVVNVKARMIHAS